MTDRDFLAFMIQCDAEWKRLEALSADPKRPAYLKQREEYDQAYKLMVAQPAERVEDLLGKIRRIARHNPHLGPDDWEPVISGAEFFAILTDLTAVAGQPNFRPL